jgi:L-malate glycosyltransferase
MTIAIISVIRDSWGGSEELWYQMAKIALANGHTVIHHSFENPEKYYKKIELEKLGLISLYRPGYVPKNSTDFKRFLYLCYNFLRKKLYNPFRRLDKFKPDLIIYNGSCYSIKDEPLLIKFLKVYKKHLFYIGHLNSDNIQQLNVNDVSIIRQIYRRSKFVFFVSEKNKKSAERHLSYKINNSLIIRNPVNLKTPTIIPFPIFSDKSNLCMAIVGNLHTSHKGQDLVLEVLSGNIWRNRNWKLNIFGSGYDDEYLKELCQLYKIENKVTFHGRVKDVSEIWKQNHLLVLPSHIEGMPLVVVEAMLCGRACLVTDVGGNEEWIEDGINGFIAEAASVNSIRKTLEKMWNARNNLNEMGKLAFSRANSIFNQNAGETLLNKIEESLHQKELL